MKSLLTLFLICLISLSSSELSGQCDLDAAVQIAPLVVTDERVVEIEVSGLPASNLATNQSLCAVSMQFDHGAVGDLRFTLTSPAGQSITLLGPGMQNSGLSPLINWDVTLLPCIVLISPDAGFGPLLDGTDPWATFTNYEGSYYPYGGCLEDFNMGSAEGTWRLNILNLGNSSGVLDSFALQFCNGDASCSTCDAFAGNFTSVTVNICEGWDTSIPAGLDDLPMVTPQDSAFYSIESETGELVFIDNDFLTSTLSGGTYEICPVWIQKADLTALDNVDTRTNLDQAADDYCMDIGNCLNLVVTPFMNERILVRDICLGDTVMYDGKIYDSALDTSIYFGTPIGPCTDVTRLTINVTEVETILSGSGDTLLCGEATFLDGSASNSSSGPISEYNWSTPDGNFLIDLGPVAQVNAGGTYYLETKANGCASLDSMEVIGADTFFLELIPVDGSCNADLFQVVLRDSTAAGIGMTDIDQVFLSGPGSPSFVQMDDTLSISLPEQGLYEITAVAGRCQTISTIAYSGAMGSGFSLTVTAPDSLGCDGLPVNILIDTDAVDPLIVFEGPEPIADNTMMPAVLLPGPYQITVTDNQGCSQTAEVEVAVNLERPMIIVADTIRHSCLLPFDERTIEVEGVGAIVDWSWTGPMGFQSNDQNITASNIGNYTVTATTSTGCNVTKTVIVMFTNEWVGFTGRTTILPCVGGKVELCPENLEPGGPNTFVWRKGAATISQDSCFFTYEAGEYSLSVISEFGCASTNPYVVEEAPDTISAVIELDSLVLPCGFVELDASASNYPSDWEITWQINGVANPNLDSDVSISAFSSGEYVLSLSDTAIGCLIMDTVLLTITPTINEQMLIRDICLGDTVMFNGEVYDTALDTSIFMGSAMDSCASVTHLTINVTQVETNISGPGNILICGETTYLDGAASTSSSGTISEYNWSTLDGNFLIDTGSVAQVDAGGTYYLETKSNGCSAVDSLEVVIADTFYLEFIPVGSPCVEELFQFVLRDSTVAGIGMTEFDQVSLIGPSMQSYDQMGDTLSIQMPEQGLYEITAEAGNCQTVGYIEYLGTLDSAFSLIVTAPDTLECDGQPVNILVDTDAVDPMIIFDGPQPIAPNTLMPAVLLSGTYQITVTDIHGCTETAEVQVVTKTEWPEILIPDTIIYSCILPIDERTIEVDANGDIVAWSWIGPSGFQSEDQNIFAQELGEYTVTATDSNGCSTSSSVTVMTITGALDLGPDQTIMLGESLQIAGLTNLVPTTYEWSDEALLSCVDCLDTELMPTSSMMLSLTITDEDGCTATDELNIIVIKEGEVPVYFPTVFQPGLTGEEVLTLGVDLFRVQSIEMKIYDRWGGLMVDDKFLTTTNQIPIWDGGSGNDTAAQGVYVYMATLLYINGEEEILTGTITLLR